MTDEIDTDAERERIALTVEHLDPDEAQIAYDARLAEIEQQRATASGIFGSRGILE